MISERLDKTNYSAVTFPLQTDIEVLAGDELNRLMGTQTFLIHEPCKLFEISSVGFWMLQDLLRSKSSLDVI